MSQPQPPALPSRYRDVHFVAEGAFGHVYRATGDGDRALAVKVLAPAWASDADALWRFTAEYRRLAALAHPAFPATVEEGLTADGRPFFAMTYMPGQPLDAVGPLPPDEVKRVLSAIALALRHLHSQGLVHGDLKAANVLFDGEQASLLDVGSAAAIGQRRETIEGTPEYLAPEVLRQAEVAPEADWYALGVLAYWLLAGRLPFNAEGTGASSLVHAQLFQAPEPLPATVEDQAPALAAAVMALLAKDPDVRHGALESVFSALGVPYQAEQGGLRSAWVPRPAFATAWQRLASAEGADVLMLEGPTGAGKSRALDALRLEARLGGRAWIAAACAGAGEAPGSVARVLLRQALSAAGLPTSENVEAWLAGGIPAAWLDLEPRARKLSLFGALAEAWAAAVGALGGLVAGLDDWDVADALSREIVEHLRSAPAGRRTRWCLTGAPGAAPAGTDTLTLTEWSDADVLALAAARLGAPVPGALADALAAVQAHQPGLVNALLDSWFASGALRPERGGWAFTLGASAVAGNDPWERLWAERLARLTPAALEVARLAGLAHAAGPLPERVLARALGLTDAGMQLALDTLLGSGVLAKGAQGVRLAVASHATTLAEGFSEADRRRLAARLARGVLEREPDATAVPGDDELVALPLPTLMAASRLAARGDDDDLAVALAGMAARRALEHLALDDAVRTLAEARDRLTTAVPAARRLQLFLAGGEAARISDRLDDAAEDLTRAEAIASETENHVAVAQALLALAKVRQLRGRYDEALDLASRAETAAARAGRPALAARAAVLRARVELFTTGHVAARASCARAVALAAAGQAPAMRSAALNLQGVLLAQDEPQAKDEALGMIREAVALAEGVGDLVGVAAALENLGNAYTAIGELREAREVFARDVDHCRAYGIGTEGLSAEMNLALVLAGLGETAAATQLAEEVVARSKALGRTFIRAIARAAAGQAAWRAGHGAEALAALEDALALAKSIENRYAEAYIRQDRLEAFLALGEVARAQEEVVVGSKLADDMSLGDVAARLAVLRAELARVEGDLERAVSLAQPHATGSNRALALAAHGVLGRVHLAAGRSAEARAQFEAAAAIARAWHAPWHLAAARLGLARSASDPSEVIAQAREALTPGPNLLARAGAACLLAHHGALDAAGRAALTDLSDAVAEMPEDARERLFAAQGLPTGALIAQWRAQVPVNAGHALAGLADLAAWHEAVLDARDEGTIHQTLLSGLMTLSQADRGYLLGYEKGRLLEVVTLGVDYQEEVAHGFSSSIAEEALFTGEPIYLVNALADERWQAAASVQALGLRTVIALPYGTAGQLLGVVYMDRAAIEPTLGADDQAALALLTRVAATRVVELRRQGEAHAELGFERLVGQTAIAIARAGGVDARGALLEACLTLTGAQRAFWLARPSVGEPWAALATRDATGAALSYQPDKISQTVLGQATDEREAVCLIETDRPESWTPGQSLLSLGIRMVWCLPVGASELEAVYLDTTRLDALDPRALSGRITALLERFESLFVKADGVRRG